MENIPVKPLMSCEVLVLSVLCFERSATASFQFHEPVRWTELVSSFRILAACGEEMEQLGLAPPLVKDYVCWARVVEKLERSARLGRGGNSGFQAVCG